MTAKDNSDKGVIFFPGMYNDNCVPALKELIFQFVEGDLVENPKINADVHVYGLRLPPEEEDKASYIAERISGFRFFLDDEEFEVKACVDQNLQDALNQFHSNIFKVEVSAEFKDGFEKVKDDVKSFVGKIFNNASNFESGKKLFFQFKLKEDAEKCANAITSTIFRGIYLTVDIKGIKKSDQEQEPNYTQMRADLHQKIGADGIRKEQRKIAETLIKGEKFSNMQILQLYKDEGKNTNYFKFFSLMLMIFQFPVLADEDYITIVDDCKEIRGSITGRIKLAKSLSPKRQREAIEKITECFKKQSVMRLSAFCWQPDAQKPELKFTTDLTHMPPIKI